MAALADPESSHTDRFSVQAILAYAAVGQATIFGCLLFYLIHQKIAIDPLMAALLGGYMAFLYNQGSNAFNYFLGSSSGAKSANAAMAQIAGAGAPPPAAPLAGDGK